MNRKKGEEENRPADTRTATAAAGPRAKEAAAAAAATADGGDYEGRHRRPKHSSNRAGPSLQQGEPNQERQGGGGLSAGQDIRRGRTTRGTQVGASSSGFLNDFFL